VEPAFATRPCWPTQNDALIKKRMHPLQSGSTFRSDALAFLNMRGRRRATQLCLEKEHTFIVPCGPMIVSFSIFIAPSLLGQLYSSRGNDSPKESRCWTWAGHLPVPSKKNASPYDLHAPADITTRLELHTPPWEIDAALKI
jgi:hypothetical protein